MRLWITWLDAVRLLRPACSRMSTFVWMIFSLIGMCARATDQAGVTSYMRVLGFCGKAYNRLLGLFHSSALDLDRLTAEWLKLCLQLFTPVTVGPRLVCLADGLKAPKEGRKMPGVKRLHQESNNNTKPEYVMGHSFQAISLLVQGPGAHAAAVPLVSRIHEGLVFSNRDSRTLLDKLAALLLSVAKLWCRQILLVADAYYASGGFMAELLAHGHHLLTRAKSNAVAYLPPPNPPEHRRRGRPRVYGEKVRLKDLAAEDSKFTSAPSPVYGDSQVILRYRCINLIWRPAARLVRFVIVHHPKRGTIFLLSTDLTLEPLQMIQLYGFRFKIELGFRQALHVLGAYAYHFWMSEMEPIRRGQGDQYLHRTSQSYRNAVVRKVNAYHRHVQLGCVAQGLLQHLAINHSELVWDHLHEWFRTMNRTLPPSELLTAYALRAVLPEFFGSRKLDPNMREILDKYRATDFGLTVKRRAA
jgi:hypothetical protein